MNCACLSRTALFFLLIVSATVMGGESDSFSFGGFNLQQTPAQLKTLFPLSRVEQSKKVDGNRSESVWVRVDPGEVKNQVTYAQYHIFNGKLQKLSMNFERPLPPGKPSSYFDDPFNHMPTCSSILPALKSAYGKPSGPHEQYTDTQVEYAYVWEKPDQKLVLTCAGLADSKDTRTWAMELVIAPSKDGECRNRPCYFPVL